MTVPFIHSSEACGLAGTMMATIVSAAVSLFLVYNVVLGGNKPQGGASATRKLTKSAKPTSNAPAVNEKQGGTRSWWNNTQSDDDQTVGEAAKSDAATVTAHAHHFMTHHMPSLLLHVGIGCCLTWKPQIAAV